MNNFENTKQIKLGNLKELAKNTKPRTFKQIQDFKYVPVNIEVTQNTYKNKMGGEFVIKEATLYNEDTDEVDKVRIPNSVINGLHVLLKDNPELEYFRVLKSGEGLNTQYTVLPVTNKEILGSI